MILTTTLLALGAGPLVSPTTAERSALHPAGADLYVEVPDVDAFRAAWAQTGIARMLLDPEIQAALGKTLGQESLDPLALALGQYRGQVEAGTFPDVLAALAQIGALSFSATLPDDYTPGDWSKEPAGQVVIEFKGEEGAAHFLALLEGMSEGALARSAVDIGGREASSLVLGDGPQAPRMTQLGSRLILTAGSAWNDDLLQRLSGGETRGLAAAKTLAAAELGTDGVTVMQGFSSLDLATLGLMDARWQATAAQLAEACLGVYGAMGTRGGTWRVALSDGRYVIDGVQRHGGGEPPVIAHTAFDQGQLARLHPEPVLAWMTSLDGEGLAELARAGEREALGQDEDREPFAEFAAESGFRPDTDLLAHLGPWVGLDMPSPRGLISAPDFKLRVGLRDPVAFAQGLSKALGWLTDELDGGATIEMDEYKGATLATLAFASSGGAGPGGLPMDPASFVRPTLALVGDQLLVCMLPSHAKREVRRLSKLEDEQPGQPAFLAAGRLPADSLEMGYADWAGLVGDVYGGLKALAPMLGMGGGELPFDPNALPDAQLFTRHFSPTVRWKRAVEGGVHHHSESSFGPELLLAQGIGGWLGASSAGMLQQGTATGSGNEPYEFDLDGGGSDE